jgi:acyl-coenzyme A synthetase/AMP-(fatty) acid ligase
VRFHARFRPNAPAIVGLRRVPFWKFEQDIRRAVHELGDLKVEPDQSVSVALGRPYVAWVIDLALMRLGIASAPGGDSESAFRITDNPQASGSNVLLLTDDRMNAIVHGPERALVRRRPDPEAMARIFRTSGTTGEPKRIALSWRVLIANIMEGPSWHGSKAGVWWVTTGEPTPFGFYLMLMAHVCGFPAAVGLGARIDSVLKVKPRLLGLLPLHIQMLLDIMPAGHPKWPLTLISGGSAISPQMAEQIRERLTDDVVSGYGSTETAGITVADLDLLRRHPLSAGYILPGVDVRIVDDDGVDLPSGELGRVCVRTDKMAMGYPGDPEATAKFFRDGWFHSTDLGRIGEENLLFLEGRADELMNLGGHKVLPGTIDAALAKVPGVKEAAAFAFKAKGGVDRCGIAVVAGEGFDLAAVRSAAATRLTKAQRTEVMVIDALPRNIMGKVERLKLRAMIEAKVGAKAS